MAGNQGRGTLGTTTDLVHPPSEASQLFESETKSSWFLFETRMDLFPVFPGKDKRILTRQKMFEYYC
jgi:hypothetical protein